jgi:glutamate-1-semialdehyde aminotransferase
MKEILRRDVFDALMLAYNPLGHHLVTYRAKTVWEFETPPQPVANYEREDLWRTRDEILPMARERDVGVLLMKPLAGGLLCQGKAFPSRMYRAGLPEYPAPPVILRHLLDTEPVAAVVPGMASVAEVEENVAAGEPVAEPFPILQTALCSRCGDCDDLCSQGLPVSYLFRAAYHYLYPTAPFGISTTLQYFRLHPWEEARCASCTNRTCRCESLGIDIPAELTAIHAKMLELREAGVVPRADQDERDFQSGERRSAKLLSLEVFGERVVLHLRNTGQEAWPVGMALTVAADGVPLEPVRLRQTVWPTGDGHFAFEAPAHWALTLQLEDFWRYQTRPAFRAEWVRHDVVARYPAGARVEFRLAVRNAGAEEWPGNPANGHAAGLCCFLDGEYHAVGHLAVASVRPGETVGFVVSAQMPEQAGRHELRFDMAVYNEFWFRDKGSPTLDLTVEVVEAARSVTDKLLAISHRRNRSYFSPGMSVHRSKGEACFPVFAESAAGCVLTDVDGAAFTDVLMGWGCHLLGYSEPRVVEAVQRAVAAGGGVLSLPHRLEMEVTELVCSRFPWGEEAIFGKNGSDVTTWAVRTARVATGRKVILGAGYFGWADWFAGMQGIDKTGVPAGNNPYFLPLPFLDIAALEQAAALHAGDLAAIMIEPAAMCVHPKDPQHWTDGPYFRRARELADQYGALLIFDEIMTGFRFRSGSATKAFGVTADLTCLGKAIANGMPLSALVSRKGLLMNHVDRIMYAPTMKGETHSFAAAKAALGIYATEAVPVEVWAAGEAIRSGVREACLALGLRAALIGPPYRMYFKFFDLEAEGDMDVVLHTLLQQELARHRVISVKGYVIVCRAHDEAAQARIVEAYTRALRTVAAAMASADPQAYLEVPRLPIERRTVVPSEKQL